MVNSYDRIYAVVRKIPVGKVATYGQVAELAGLIGKPRVVGYALYKVAVDDDIPWQRVINAKGEISTSAFRDGSDDLQRVILDDDRWQPSPEMIEAIDFEEDD